MPKLTKVTFASSTAWFRTEKTMRATLQSYFPGLQIRCKDVDLFEIEKSAGPRLYFKAFDMVDSLQHTKRHPERASMKHAIMDF